VFSWLTLLWLWCLAGPVFAQASQDELSVRANGSPTRQINDHVLVLADRHSLGTLPLSVEGFEPLVDRELVGYSDHDFWFRIRLANPMATSQKRVVYLDNRTVKDIALYQEQPAGGFDRVDTRWTTSLPAYTVTLPADARATFYLRVRFAHLLKTNFYLSTVEHYQHKEKLLFGLPVGFFGLSLGIVIYSFLIFLFVKEWSYLLFLGFAIPAFVCVATVNGFHFMLLQVDLHEYVLPIVANIALIGASWFSNFVMKTARYTPVLYLWQRCLQMAAGTSIVFILIGLSRPLFGYITDFNLFLSVALAMVSGVKVIPFFPRVAITYVTSWLVMLTGMLIWFANRYGLLPDTLWAVNALNIGYNCQLILLAIGIGEKINLLKKHNEQEKLEKALLLKDLENTRLMQQALLHQAPKIEGVAIETYYQAANKAGGDWYSCYFDDEAQVLYTLVGDVTGHGVESALITGAAAGALHSFFSYKKRKFAQCIDLCQCLTDIACCVNEAVYRTGMASNNLMTMVFFAIDLPAGQAYYINAGHTPILQRTEQRVKGIIQRGSPLGLSLQPRFRVKEIPYQSGDVFLMYTDGLFENQLGRKQRVLDKRLQAHLQERQSLAYIKDKIVNDFVSAGTHEDHDDVTFILIQVHDRASRLTA
jgi:serine phosphatase RsbU (regulator of sigma subunit)